ncbi:hypothetical protein [Gluconacetobacter tumulicola]|uniref:Antitoxin Xre/MbcA/ParS-like toxin-binding domain-containing protein n=1 Tax=Gluconacetobacter tumulicola TaxID=1017177 RepID=A0A7W4JCP8_9PROT|nr:hypothetical protein [Gluconacetobacter tumulicola]MBB2178622.1 hypothetical protein [Gluconacetobacter tumulicola]
MPTTPVSETRARATGAQPRARRTQGSHILNVGSVVTIPAGLELAVREKPASRARAARLPLLEYEVRRKGSPAASRKTATDAYAVGPRGRALLRGQQIKDDDLRRAGGAYTLDQVRELLRITRQAIEKRVREQSLLAVPGPSGERRYPVTQFTADGVLPGLKAVLTALPGESAWFRLNFLVTPLAQLDGRTPVEALTTGPVDAVVETARTVGVQGG